MNNSLKKCSYSSNLDRISELSDSIIYHIQSFLPLKDAARTCILSKSWNHASSLYPILFLHHHLFTLQSSLSDHNLTMESFLDFVDNRLLRVKHEKQCFRMLGISFSLASTDISKYSSRIDQWMELITQATHVHEFSFTLSVAYGLFRVLGSYSYDLKLSILATKGLESLTLNGCGLKDCYSNHNKNISTSLRHLTLIDVCLSRDAWDSLASYCLSIETIELKECYTLFKRFSLSKFSKSLNKATLSDFSGCKRVILTGTNLTSFTHESYPPCCEIDVAACTLIKQLSLDVRSLYVRGEADLFQNFTHVFPVIEEVNIFVRAVKSGFDSKILKVASHHHLRTFIFDIDSEFEKAYITDCPNLTRLEFLSPMKELHVVDCPNLRRFCYCGSLVPSLLFNASNQMESMKWVFGYSRVDNFWFVQLRKFVKQMSAYTFDLRLLISEVMDSPTSKQNQGEDETFTKESNINLELCLDHDIENQESLLNWSLWSTCPSTLFVYGKAYDLLKELCDKLSKRYDDKDDQDQTCKGKSFCNEHWWHHVKDFEVECPSLEIQDIKGNLATLMEFHKATRCNFTFKFHWYSNDIS